MDALVLARCSAPVCRTDRYHLRQRAAKASISASLSSRSPVIGQVLVQPPTCLHHDGWAPLSFRMQVDQAMMTPPAPAIPAWRAGRASPKAEAGAIAGPAVPQARAGRRALP